MNCKFSYNQHSAGYTWHELFILSAAVSNDQQVFCRTSAIAAKTIQQQVRDFAIRATFLVKNILSVEGQRHFQTTNVGVNRMATYGHLNRLPHTKLAPELHTDVVDALDFAVLQMDKVLNHSQKTAFINKTLVLKTYEFKGFGSFRCASAVTKIFKRFRPNMNMKL